MRNIIYIFLFFSCIANAQILGVTASSVEVVSAPPTITVGNTSNSGWLENVNATTTFSHTCTADTKMLVLSITISEINADPDITGITYNSVAMDEVVGDFDATADQGVYIYSLAAPTTGSAQDIVVNFNNTDVEEVMVTAVDLETITGTIELDVAGTVNTLTTGDPTASITTVAEHTIMIDAMQSAENSPLTIGVDQTVLYNLDMGVNTGAASYRIVNASGIYTFDWTLPSSAQKSKMVVVSFKSLN